MLFIYENDKVKDEGDDLKEAITYFHPPSTPLDVQTGVCGQLIGMTQCFYGLTGEKPNIFKTKHLCYAVRPMSCYTIGLAINGDESVATKQLKSFCSLILFYHDDLSSFFEKNVSYVQRKKLLTMYLDFIQHFGNRVTSAFQSLPYVEVPDKDQGINSLQCRHLAEYCLYTYPVYGSCILYRNCILYTDLCSEITFRLLIVGTQKQANNCSTEVNDQYDLPEGVQVLNVYLTEEDLATILSHVKHCLIQQSKRPQNLELSSSSSPKDEEHITSFDDNTPADLFVQSNSDMVIFLLMKKSASDNAKSMFEEMWKQILPKLAEIEINLQLSIQSNSSNKKPDDMLSYNYLQFEGLKRCLLGKIAVSEKSELLSADENHFCESAIQLHNTFANEKNAKECILRNHSSVIYRHQMMNQETYFQKCFGSRFNFDGPSEKDNTMLIDKKAKDKLSSDQGIYLM